MWNRRHIRTISIENGTVFNRIKYKDGINIICAFTRRKQTILCLIFLVTISSKILSTSFRRVSWTNDSIARKESACDSARKLNPNAIITNTSIITTNRNHDDYQINFSMMVFSPLEDQYISKKILQHKMHEPDLTKFISNALSTPSGTTNDNSTQIWAVDIGANLGYHALHMANEGAHVIAFEPAPDTRSLFKCSVEMSGLGTKSSHSSNGSIQIIPYGASDTQAMGKMSRHPKSPGMTTFQSIEDNPFPLESVDFDKYTMDVHRNNNDGGNNTNNTASISLVRVQDILEAKGVPEGRSHSLRLLKLDVEGFEIKALKGLNLTRFPFQFFTFEYFPYMLKDSAGTDPVDLLLLVKQAGYACNIDDKMGLTRQEMSLWSQKISRDHHVNVYCELK